MSTRFIVKSERFDEAWPEAGQLGARHFAEVEGDLATRRPYRVDERMMREADLRGTMRFFIARDMARKIIGYCTWNIGFDVESEGLLIATQGAWFVDPTSRNRRVGLALFQKSVHELRLAGVKNLFPHHRLLGAGKGLGRFFARLGATEIQHTYSLWIGD